MIGYLSLIIIFIKGSFVTIHELLEEYRKRISNNRDLGTSFERLIKSYFQLDPLYSTKFKNVWLWNEWKGRWGQDCGIDLVAENVEGEYFAIQCKFYASDYDIKKGDIDSFFTESGRKFKLEGKGSQSFSYRIIVSTSDHWTENAEKSQDKKSESDSSNSVKLETAKEEENAEK